jgi:spore coat protein CotH
MNSGAERKPVEASPHPSHNERLQGLIRMSLKLSRVRLAAALLTLALGGAVGVRLHAVSVARLNGVLPTLPSDALFNDTVLHEVRLDINSRDWQTLKDNYLTNEYYPCDFRWNGQVVRNVGIRSRGQASRSATKPSLRVDFNRYTASQTLLDLKSVVLRNNSTDFSNLHERISMLLYARMGLPAPRVAHAMLYINSNYQGLYSIVESLDKAFLSRNFDENDGYLYKYDRLPTDPPYYLDYLGPSASLYSPHPFNPETHEDNPKPQPIADLIRTVHDATENSFPSAIAQYLDVNQFIRNIAVTVYMGDEDGFLGNWGMNNFDVYQLQNTTIHVIIPWDKSEATRSGPTYSIFHNIDDVPASQHNKLMERLLAVPAFKALYLDSLALVADTASELIVGDGRGWMEREVDRESAQIQAAVLADTTKSYTNDQYTVAIEDLRRFARERADFVRSEIARYR